MKLHFEPDLDFQREAIEAVCHLFRGQEVCRTEFTIATHASASSTQVPAFASSDLGIGNRLTLPDKEIFKNLKGTTKNWAASLSGMSSHHEKISPGEGLPRPASFSGGGRRQFFVVP